MLKEKKQYVSLGIQIPPFQVAFGGGPNIFSRGDWIPKFCQGLMRRLNITWQNFGNSPLLGGLSQDLHVVHNHGDRKSPRPGVVGPLPNG